MTGLEDTFRQVLAARLPDDPKWAAWIDGTVQELAASVPGRPDMAMVEALTQARRDRDAAEAQVAQARALCDERQRVAEASPARMFNGDPFPAMLGVEEVRTVLGVTLEASR